MYTHQPVLLQEVIRCLDIKPNQNLIDATLGGGGYSDSFLELIKPAGKLLAIDIDLEAIKNFSSKTKFNKWQDRVTLVHGNFSQINELVKLHQFINISGIVADIGISSFQLDDSGRGISFQKNEPLDMRFDQASTNENAQTILNTRSEQELIVIFTKYGEEKYSKSIAKHIIQARVSLPILNTQELVALIQASLPKPVKHKWTDSARRIFQSLRIAVNNELENLQSFLPQAFKLLQSGGRLAVITFHSLEDRIVKNYFRSLSIGCICPKNFPICVCGHTAQGSLITKKPISVSEEELRINSRASSAKLRVIKKN